jgi:hypothetical protein
MEKENLLPSDQSLAQVLESLITALDSLADTFPLTMKAILGSQNNYMIDFMRNFVSLINEYLEFHNKGIGNREDINRSIEALSEEEKKALIDNQYEMYDKVLAILQDILADISWMKNSSQRFPSISAYIHKVAGTMKKMILADKIIMQGFIISLISQYDTFLGKLIRALFLIKPETLNVSEKNISFAHLTEFRTLDDAREYIMGKEIEGVLRESHIEQFNWLENKFGLELRKGLTIWPVFVEITERRNLFTHTGGIVSDQYLNVCQKQGVEFAEGVKLGTELGVPNDYFQLAYECIFEISIKLAHVLWRKVAPQDIKNADSNLIAISYDLLLKEQYKLACVILDFATDTLKKHSTESSKRTLIINKAQAYKWVGDDEKAKKIVNSTDWSASSDKYKLAVAVLLDDFNTADDLVRKIGPHGEVTMFNYREWPLFKEYRKSEEFLKVFEEVFNEPFYSEKDLFAAMDWFKEAIDSENISNKQLLS